MQSKTLYLTLHKKWFEQILKGVKKMEYRDIKPYWTKRLFDKNGKPKKYTEILFKNGYSNNCPWMRVKFLGLEIGNGKYSIKLGQVIKARNI